jgi:hypothetical protein
VKKNTTAEGLSTAAEPLRVIPLQQQVTNVIPATINPALFPVQKEASGVFIVHGAESSIAARVAAIICVPVYFSVQSTKCSICNLFAVLRFSLWCAALAFLALAGR